MSAFEDYVASLNKLFVIDNIEAWGLAVRSKTAIRSGIKRAFVDPSIAIASLGLSPEALMTQLKTFGFIFEQMIVMTGGSMAYTRPDGVRVIPLACLKD